MSELLKQINKSFYKSSFKNGMVVELDTGERRLFWDDRFIDEHGYIPLCYYDENLNNMDRIDHKENIDKIFTVKNVGYFSCFFMDRNLTEIWNRYK